MGHSQPSTCLLRQHIIFLYFQHLSGPSLLLLAPLLSEITSNRLLASGRLLCRVDKVLLSPRADLVTESSCSLLKAHQWLSNTRVAVIWEEPLFLAIPQSGSFKEERNQPRGSPNAVSGIFPSPLYVCVCFFLHVWILEHSVNIPSSLKRTQRIRHDLNWIIYAALVKSWGKLFVAVRGLGTAESGDISPLLVGCWDGQEWK